MPLTVPPATVSAPPLLTVIALPVALRLTEPPDCTVSDVTVPPAVTLCTP